MRAFLARPALVAVSLLCGAAVAFAQAEQSVSEDDFSPLVLPESLEDQLYAIGYLESYDNGPRGSGVVKHDEARAQPGRNLVLSPDTLGAYVVDMQGLELQRWRFDVWKDWRGDPLPGYVVDAEAEHRNYWSRALPLDDGGVIFIHKGIGLFRLNAASEIVWACFIKAHHDFHVQPDGSIYTLAREDQTIQGHTFSDDFVVVVSAEGEVQRQFSISEAILASPYAPLIQAYGDAPIYLHTNKIEVLDGSWAEYSPHFKKGNILLSCRNIHALVVVDPEKQEVVWALTGLWLRQHDPQLLDNAHLLVFDNRGNAGYSRVIELNPFTQEIYWIYQAEPRSKFSTLVGGTSQRLPNGNTLITESTRGRTFEVTPGKQIVWEFINPVRIGPEEKKISPLFEVRRLVD